MQKSPEFPNSPIVCQAQVLSFIDPKLSFVEKSSLVHCRIISVEKVLPPASEAQKRMEVIQRESVKGEYMNEELIYLDKTGIFYGEKSEINMCRTPLNVGLLQSWVKRRTSQNCFLKNQMRWARHSSSSSAKCCQARSFDDSSHPKSARTSWLHGTRRMDAQAMETHALTHLN